MHILSSRERPRVCTVESKFWLENVQKTSSRRTQCTVKFQVKHKSRLQKYKERNKSWPYFSPVRGFWWYPVQNFLWQYLSSSCHHNIRAKLSAFHVETSNSLTMSISLIWNVWWSPPGSGKAHIMPKKFRLLVLQNFNCDIYQNSWVNPTKWKLHWAFTIAPSSIHRFMYEDTKEAHGELCHAVAPPSCRHKRQRDIKSELRYKPTQPSVKLQLVRYTGNN